MIHKMAMMGDNGFLIEICSRNLPKGILVFMSFRSAIGSEESLSCALISFRILVLLHAGSLELLFH